MSSYLSPSIKKQEDLSFACVTETLFIIKNIVSYDYEKHFVQYTQNIVKYRVLIKTFAEKRGL